MSKPLIAHSPDLKRLQDEGYDIEVRERFLLVRSFPHLNSKREVKYGILVMPLDSAGDGTAQPQNHVAYFIGEAHCHMKTVG